MKPFRRPRNARQSCLILSLCVFLPLLCAACTTQSRFRPPDANPSVQGAATPEPAAIDETNLAVLAEQPSAPREEAAVAASALAALVPTPTPAATRTQAESDAADATDEASSPPPASAPEAGTGGEAMAEISVSLVNVRGGPGLDYEITGSAAAGDAFTIAGRNEDASWLQLCCLDPSGQPGWVRADLLEAASATSAPVVEAPPTPTPAPASAAAPAAAAGGDQSAALAAAPAAGLPRAGDFGPAGGVNPLTGGPIDGARSGQRPLIVCINNDFAARPQYGISQADVMYEYLMEGYGITRFSGVFYGDEVGQIGPVRSARLINYYMTALYDAGLVCSGASDRVRYMLKHEAPFPYLDIDLDDPSNARYSASIGSDYRTRLRTSTAGLRQWLADWGVERPAAMRSFTFGDAPGGASATTVEIPYPRATGSQVLYQYDPANGRYLRTMGGSPHRDGNTGAQIGVENVVVQYVPHETTDIVEDSLGSLSIRLNLFGSGRALVVRDGMAFPGTWRSDSRGDLPRFFAEDGAEIPLKPGRTWVSVVPFDYTVSYQ